MTLTNIEYGSLASSEVLNDNFSYLNDKIEDEIATLNTNISSILSNIATINSRIGDLSDEFETDIELLDAKLEDYKTKIMSAINGASMAPNWLRASEINDITNYEVSDNGFLLINPSSNSSGNITVNNIVVSAKSVVNSDDYSSELITLPVKKDDVVTVSFEFNNAYFVPNCTFVLSENNL